jgi:hypothetical protein
MKASLAISSKINIQPINNNNHDIKTSHSIVIMIGQQSRPPRQDQPRLAELGIDISLMLSLANC